MVLAFKKDFVNPILTGRKIHTVREDIHGRWKAGRSIQMATGVRTKNYNCFKEGACVSTQDIFMTYAHSDIIEISVDGRELFGREECLEFAMKDGFKSWRDFFDWFYPLIEKTKDKAYIAKVIHWTDFAYKR